MNISVWSLHTFWKKKSSVFLLTDVIYSLIIFYGFFSDVCGRSRGWPRLLAPWLQPDWQEQHQRWVTTLVSYTWLHLSNASVALRLIIESWYCNDTTISWEPVLLCMRVCECVGVCVCVCLKVKVQHHQFITAAAAAAQSSVNAACVWTGFNESLSPNATRQGSVVRCLLAQRRVCCCTTAGRENMSGSGSLSHQSGESIGLLFWN